MKIVALTDIHGQLRFLDQVASILSSADLILLVGDITTFGREEVASQVISAIRQHNAHILAVPGNTDYPEVRDYLKQEGINLHRSHITIEGITFIGLGGALPAPAKTPYEFTEGQLGAFLREASAQLPPDTTKVLVSHQPPQGTLLDIVHSGQHVGSRAVRDFILQERPLVCFTGHIHESPGIDSLGQTQIINPGPFAYGNYAYAEINGGKLELLEIRSCS